jgi:hypothetical protein
MIIRIIYTVCTALHRGENLFTFSLTSVKSDQQVASHMH